MPSHAPPTPQGALTASTPPHPCLSFVACPTPTPLHPTPPHPAPPCRAARAVHGPANRADGGAARAGGRHIHGVQLTGGCPGAPAPRAHSSSCICSQLPRTCPPSSCRAGSCCSCRRERPGRHCGRYCTGVRDQRPPPPRLRRRLAHPHCSCAKRVHGHSPWRTGNKPCGTSPGPHPAVLLSPPRPCPKMAGWLPWTGTRHRWTWPSGIGRRRGWPTRWEGGGVCRVQDTPGQCCARLWKTTRLWFLASYAAVPRPPTAAPRPNPLLAD
jgi:hypothetical protein